MESLPQPPPPPLAAAPAPSLAATAAAPPAHLNYPESVDSSPRSRAATDSWETPAAAAATDQLPPKLRLMCSYGGHIVPRPHDKSLCYVGGDTRIIVLDRGAATLSSLSAHLSKTLLNNRPFTLKYQLPSEDLDSLITVSTDEDLENMIDEYDRTMLNSSSASKPSRLRLFLFPSKPDSSQSIGPILESSTKSDDWFLNALNNAGVLNRGFSDSAPGNCLLNLDDEVGINNVETGSRDADGSSSLGNEKSVKQAQDVHSVPDSPMLETTSSFGSTSSSPSIANLPSIRVQVEENVIGGGGGIRVLQDQKLGIEEQFARMAMGTGIVQKPDDGFVMMSSPPTVPAAAAVTGVPVGSAAVAPPGDYSNRVFSDDERSDHAVPLGFRKLPLSQQQPQPPQSQQKPSGVLDLPSPDSVSSDGSLTNPLARPKPVIFQDQAVQMSLGINRGPTNAIDPNINISEQSTGVQLQQHIQDARYVLQPQIDQRQPQQHQQPQQQFVQAGPHYIQHHPQGSMPVAAYYMYPSQQHQVQHHQLDQQYPVYYMPVSQPQPYNLSAQQTSPNEAATANPSNRPQATQNSAVIPQSAAYSNPIRNPPGVKTDLASGVYRMASASASPLVQVPAGQQQQYVGYSQVHPSQSVAPSSGAPATYGYEYSNPATGQIYYAQHLAPSQYQTMTAPMPEASGQLSGESIKQQMRTS
ncbi:PB1 domain-containing protein, partial [Psidium guajava]